MKIKLKRTVSCILSALIFASASSNISAAKITQIAEDQYSSIKQEFTPLDISKQANRAFADEVANDGKGGWGDGGPTNDLRDFKIRGEQYLRGVLFNIIEPDDNDDKSCIVLRGQNDMSVPQSVEIDVNKKAAGVYFLHAGSWLSERVGQYVFVYADGSEEAVEIVGGRDMSDWWGVSETDTVRTAWKGEGYEAGIISLGLFAMPNPYPDKEIAKLRLQSYGDATYPMIVAITLTDSGPYLPKTKVSDKFNPDTSEWYPYSYPREYEKIRGTAMDMSFLLDAPSGKHGFAHAEGENIVFEDGTRERFWGVNTDGQMMYPEYKQAEYTAEILATRGVNLARLHMPGVDFVDRNIYGWNDNISTTRSIDKEQLDKFHYYIYQLKIHGIYAFLDVTVGRQSMENDNVKDYKKVGLGAGYFDEFYKKLQKETIFEMLGAVNPYTGVSSLEEPTILVVNMNNENSIYNNNFDSEYHRKHITDMYNKWLIEKYSGVEELKNAWKGELTEEENPSDGTVRIYGSNKLSRISGQRKTDNQHFLADLVEKYTNDMTEYYRSIGGKQLISIGTVWGNSAIAYEKGIQGGDVLDFHAYFLHPTGVYSIRAGLKCPGEPISWIENGNSGLLGYFGGTRLKGKPYTISEWNSCEPNPYIADSPLLMGAYSGMQGWSPMQYTFSSDCLDINFRNSNKPVTSANVFTGPDSPQVFDVMPAAAAAFHSVAEATGGYYKAMDSERFYETKNQSLIFPVSTYLIARTGIADKSLDNRQTGLENLTLAAEKYSTENNAPYVSLTNELYMDRQNKLFKLNTPKSQAAAGFFKGKEIELEDVNIKTDTEYAVIALSSVTGEPIFKSDRLLLTASARARKTGLVMSNDGTEILDGGIPPTLIEPVKAEFLLKTDADVEVYALSSQGERMRKLAAERRDGGVYIKLLGNEKANNFEIVKSGGKRERNPQIDLGVYRDKPLFGDIAAEDREVVERVCLTEVMRPTGKTVFSPNEPIARADFVYALISALGLSDECEEYFEDVDIKKPYARALMIARNYGYIFGKDGNNFAPDEPISTEEINIILQRAGKKQYCTAEEPSRLNAAKIMYKIITE